MNKKQLFSRTKHYLRLMLLFFTSILMNSCFLSMDDNPANPIQPTSSAQSSAIDLVVFLKSGNSVHYNLDENPVTTYSDDKLIITTSSKSTTYPLEDVLRYAYVTESTGSNQQ